MIYLHTFLILAAAAAAVFLLVLLLAKNRKIRAQNIIGQLPSHYASYVALWCLCPSVLTLILGTFLPLHLEEPLAEGTLFALISLVFCLFISGGLLAIYTIKKKGSNVRTGTEKCITVVLLVCSTCAIITTFCVVLSVLFEAMLFFQTVPLSEFIFGTDWGPQISIREDQVGSSGHFGAVPLFVGTLMISAIAILVAAPLGMMSAVYLNEYATTQTRSWIKPVLEILAGIPTVVYGFFAALIVAPFLRDFFAIFRIQASSESALAAGSVMGIMLIPFICSLSDDAIHAVPDNLKEAALSLGATRSEAMRSVILPAASSGIVGGMLLAISRAVGETMIVVMASGLAAKLTFNPLDSTSTVTVQIVSLLVGDQEFDSPKTLAAFALGLTLFITTLVLNLSAFYIVKYHREKHL